MKNIPLLPRLVLLLILLICIVLPVQAVFSAVTNVDKVKLLAEPSTTATVVEVLKNGDVVKVFEKSEDGQFWKVEHKGNHGWIKSNQLSPKDYRY